LVAVTSIIGTSASSPSGRAQSVNHYGVMKSADQPAPAGAGYADDAHWTGRVEPG
jgi:hypothetical protein